MKAFRLHFLSRSICNRMDPREFKDKFHANFQSKQANINVKKPTFRRHLDTALKAKWVSVSKIWFL